MNIGGGLICEDGRNVTQAITEQQKTHAERTTRDELLTRRVGVNVSVPEYDFVANFIPLDKRMKKKRTYLAHLFNTIAYKTIYLYLQKKQIFTARKGAGEHIFLWKYKFILVLTQCQ